jgi:hypothetical protein
VIHPIQEVFGHPSSYSAPAIADARFADQQNKGAERQLRRSKSRAATVESGHL